MTMGWSEEEKKRLGGELWELINVKGPDSVWEQAVIVADLAVELVRARGGTMTAEQLASMHRALGGDDSRHWSDTQRWCSMEVGPLILHATAQGARVAELEAENDLLTQEARHQRERADVAEARVPPLEAGNQELTSMLAEWTAACNAAVHSAETKLQAVREHIAQIMAKYVALARVVGEPKR
jgi:exonuclease VII small subunit